MGRKALHATLLICGPIALLFALVPELDLTIARWFFVDGDGFTAANNSLLSAIRHPLMWIPLMIAGGAAAAAIWQAFSPARRRSLGMRQALFMVATLALGPGLTINSVLKEHHGRPRPVAVTEFGGTYAFVPWWNPGGTCPKNCSFASGEAATGFWLLAPAALTPAPWRVAATAAAIIYGAGVGLMRMSFGGHFFTDVLFAGLIIYVEIWLTYALMFGQLRPRLAQLSATLPRPWRRQARG